MDKYDNACRICLKEDGIKVPIYGEEGQYRRVAEKIKDCLNILIYPNDPLPKHICNMCYYKLDIAFDLKHEYQRSNAIYIHFLSTQRGNQSAKDYLNLVQNQPQQRPPQQTRPPPHQQQGQKRKFPDRAPTKDDHAVAGPSRKRPAPELSQTPRSLATVRVNPSAISSFTRQQQPSRSRLSPSPPHLTPQQNFPAKNNSYNHQLIYHTPEEPKSIQPLKYSCKICERSFTVPKSLKMHSIKFHKIRLQEVTPDLPRDVPSTSSWSQIKKEPEDETNETINHECDICFQQFPDDSSLNEHCKISHEESSSHVTNTDFAVEQVPITKPECIYCFQTFKNNSGLVNHLRTNHGKPSCTICLEIFSTQEDLLAHRSVHKQLSGFPKQQATVSIAKNTTEELPQPESIPKKGPFCCSLCGKSFEKKISLMRHKGHHTKLGPGWVPQVYHQPVKRVTEPPPTNDNNTQVLDLTEDEDDEDEAVIPIPKIPISKLKSNTANVPYCLYCKKMFANYRKLWDHVRKKHPNHERYKCPHVVCSRVFFSKTGYRSHLTTHKNENGVSDTISNQFNNSTIPPPVKQAPKQTVLPSVPKCEVCFKSFYNWNNLTRHFMEAHKSVPHFQCRMCVRIFLTSEFLAMHEKTHSLKKLHSSKQPHEIVKTYKRGLKVYTYQKVLCRYCPKYLSKKYIYEHEKIHRRVGAKPSVRNFTTNLKSDSQNANQSVQKELKKEVISISSSVSSPAQESEPSSKNKKEKKAFCKYCKITCVSFASLRAHLSNAHPGKLYYLCDGCPEVYYEPSALKSHAVRHSRSYKKCIHCDRTFAYLNYLKVHEKNCSLSKKVGKVGKSSNPPLPTPAPVPEPVSVTAPTPPNRTQETSRIFTCDFCEAQFLDTHAFVKHLQGHAKSM